MTTYPTVMQAGGVSLSLIVTGKHPSYDNGQTPHSPAGVAAFARMAAELTRHFPAVRSIEIGNEFNSQDFVRGPVRDADLVLRADYYMALLKAAHSRIKAVNPDTRVIGGAVLGIPAGYLAHLFAAGAADYMDALALHPYTTPVEQLSRQISVLRQIDGAGSIPIEITEFGDSDPHTAPARLLKGHCQFALSGVTRLVWYPLSNRGDGMAPLLSDTGKLTAVGKAYRFIQAELLEHKVRNASPDPFTYGCYYGPNKLVIWGEPREIRPGSELQVFTATGMEMMGKTINLSMDQPIVIISKTPIVIGENLTLAEQEILADSFHQYAYPRDGEIRAETDAFERFTRRRNREVPLVTHMGQTGPGTMWTPSLADPGDGFVRLTAQILRPAGSAAAPVEIVHRYRTETTQIVDVSAFFSPRPASIDGVHLVIRLNGRNLANRILTGPYHFKRAALSLEPGDMLEFSVGPNSSATGDVTDYRITLRRTDG
ncbi:MAG: hypothetical protein GXP05_06835 [Alphaproteobacteria bacterium]|nr:hypothetical protein [Alphaproteobacteria bacterium]